MTHISSILALIELLVEWCVLFFLEPLKSRTTEITKQTKSGRELYLKGVNPKGACECLLIASGYPDYETNYTPMNTTIETVDSEDVDAEACWGKRGTRHRSWLDGGTKYGF
eukprot:CCRYP_003872-RA/>CCRYP_003872-RA protein AED:0.47 eAED:0.59 QI:0/0/0/1/0/0/2/0/110